MQDKTCYWLDWAHISWQTRPENRRCLSWRELRQPEYQTHSRLSFGLRSMQGYRDQLILKSAFPFLSPLFKLLKDT